MKFQCNATIYRRGYCDDKLLIIGGQYLGIYMFIQKIRSRKAGTGNNKKKQAAGAGGAATELVQRVHRSLSLFP